MVLPQGLHAEKPNQVCCLKKSLYGLKQASRKWCAKLTGSLLNNGFIQSSSDHSLFMKEVGFSFMALLVYVDDIILAGNNVNHMNEVKHFLNENFRIKDLGQLSFFLGLEVTRSRKGIYINQRKYALHILENPGMLAAKPCYSPMEKNAKILFAQNGSICEEESYCRSIGRLLYLTNTRPDINYTIQFLSQFMQVPNEHHHKAINRVLKYIKASPARYVFFPCENNLQLKAFSDSDWASCDLTRKSTTGYCIYIGTSLISRKTKKQNTVSRSSSEAEYRALATTVCELQWLTFLLRDPQIDTVTPANLFCDNQDARHIATNPVFHERTKHIDIDCHVVRKKLQAGLFHLLPIKGIKQPTYVFTKALDQSAFNSAVNQLGMKDTYLSLPCILHPTPPRLP